MRRVLAAITLVLLLALSTAALGLDADRTVADDFDSGGYSGSSGSHPWDSAWTEVGESDGPDRGSVAVSSSGCSGDCLQIAALLGVTELGVYRKVDTSDADGAELRYELDFPGGLLVSGQAKVAVSVDGGGWATLKTHNAGAEGTYTVGLPVGGMLRVRLLATGLALATSMSWDEIHIEISVPEATTTTTSTTPTTVSTTSSTTTPATTKTTPPTTTSTTSTTRPPHGPPTTTAPETTTTTRPRPTTTTTGPQRPSESTTTSTSTTTTTAPGPSSTTSSTTTTVPATTTTVGAPPDPPLPPSEPPSKTFGVVVDVEPGLAAGRLDLTAQRGFVVDYLLSAEDVGLDLLFNLAVGLVLAWLSTKGLERGEGVSPSDSAGAGVR